MPIEPNSIHQDRVKCLESLPANTKKLLLYNHWDTSNSLPVVYYNDLHISSAAYGILETVAIMSAQQVVTRGYRNKLNNWQILA
jgi:hypothetical protein